MTFDHHETGKRIKAERKARKWTQAQLVDALHGIGCHVARATISQIETGKIHGDAINANLIMSLCTLFSCEPNYLFGVMQEHTTDKKWMCEFTGLSEDSIEMLSWLKLTGDTTKAAVINFLLQENHIKVSLRGMNAEDSGLLSLLCAYLTTPSFDFAKEVPEKGMTFIVGNTMLPVSGALVETALRGKISDTVKEYRKELQNTKKRKRH